MRVQHALCKGLQGSLIVLLATCSLHAAAADSHYRWLDSRGNTVLSDRPPPAGTDYEVISTRSGLKRVVKGDEGAVPREVTPKVGNEFTPVQRGTESASLKNPEICATARKNLNALKTHARLQVRDDQGDMAYISDAERLRLMNEAEALIGRHCE
jgi:hypothetical protein